MTTRVKVPLKNAGRIEAKIAANLKAAVERGMKTAARQSIPVLSARTADATPASDSPHSKPGAIATGAYLGGWEVEWGASPLFVSLVNKTAWAKYVDKGVSAKGKLMGVRAAKKLADWVEVRGIQFNDRSGRPLSSRQMAWAILTAMNRRAKWRLKPRNVGVKAKPRVAEIFRNRIRESVQRQMIKDAK